MFSDGEQAVAVDSIRLHLARFAEPELLAPLRNAAVKHTPSFETFLQ